MFISQIRCQTHYGGYIYRFDLQTKTFFCEQCLTEGLIQGSETIDIVDFIKDIAKVHKTKISNYNHIAETSQSKTNDGYDLITFQKKKEDGTIVEEYKYKIVGSEPQLVE